MASVICRVSRKATVVPRTWLLSQSRFKSSSHAATAPGGDVAVEAAHGPDAHHDVYVPTYRETIGDREVVGYGWSGEPAYADSIIWPYPAIRFRRPEAIDASLLKKELGDWKNLSVDEKKALYRYSHCETFAEMLSPSGNWKRITGIIFMLLSTALWAYMALKTIYPPLPASFNDEHRLAQLKRMIDLRVGAIDGLASKWDYDKGRWKKD